MISEVRENEGNREIYPFPIKTEAAEYGLSWYTTLMSGESIAINGEIERLLSSNSPVYTALRLQGELREISSNRILFVPIYSLGGIMGLRSLEHMAQDQGGSLPKIPLQTVPLSFTDAIGPGIESELRQAFYVYFLRISRSVPNTRSILKNLTLDPNLADLTKLCMRGVQQTEPQQVAAFAREESEAQAAIDRVIDRADFYYDAIRLGFMDVCALFKRVQSIKLLSGISLE